MTRLPIDEVLREDERGWAVRPGRVLPRGFETLAELHVVSLTPGAVRGNHRHPESTEWLLVLGGKATVAWREPGCGRRSETLDGAGPALYRFDPGVDHAIRCDDGGQIFAVAGSDVPRPATEAVEPLL